MNNIQKHFKAKRGLCMAQGGMIDPNSVDMSAIASGTVDGNGSDFDTINAERTLRWAQEDAAKRASYGQAATPSMAATDLVRGLGVRQAAPVQPAPVQQQHVDQFREPAPTTFEQDNEARGLRIQGYGADLARMRKDRLGLADGTGNLAQAGQSESAEQVMARMAAKYGVSTQPAAAPTQAPQPVQQAPAAPQRKGLMGAAMGLLRGRHAQIEAATNYAEGGIVRGKGGPTDDEVPMQVAGKDVNLSNSEAVLPVKTVQALGGPEAVEELIEETNGKPPVKGGLRAGGAYFTGTGGDVIDPKSLRPEFRGVQQTNVIQPAANAGLEAARNARVQAALNAQPNQPNSGPQQFTPNTYEAEVRARAQAAQAARAAPAPAPARVVAPRTMAEQLGRNVAQGTRRALPALRSAAGTGLAVAGTGLAAYDAHNTSATHDDFYSDDKVGFADKAMQAGRDIYRAGVPLVSGAVGMGVGTVASPTLIANPVTGAVVGSAVGTGLRSLVDADGEALTNYRKDHPNNVPAEVRNKHNAIMESVDGVGKFEPPVFDKRGGDKELAAARRNGRFEPVDEVAASGLADATKAGNFAGQNHIPEATSLADSVVADSLGGVVDTATGVSRGGDGGLRGMAQRLDTYAKNDGVRDARNMREQLLGSGARFDKGSDGKITITNRGDRDGSTKMAYTGADGKPTAVHEGSQQHMQGLKDAQGLRNQLANFEQMNLKRNAQDDITDIGLRNSSRAALAAQGAQQAELTKARIAKEPSALDLDKHELEKQKFRHDLHKTNNLQGNNVRDFKAAQSAHMAKRIQTLLDNMVPTAGLKDDALKVAQADRADYEHALYAAHTRMPADDAEFDSNLASMAEQAKLTMAHKKAMQGAGIWQKLSNAGVNPMTTLSSMAPKIVGDNFVYENGYKLPTKLVLGNDPALLAAHRAREQTK